MNDENVRIMSLLDELEELISASSKMPFTEKGIIDLEMAQKIIEDIRMNLPNDIKEAEWVRQEKNRIINDAKNEYNKVILSAQDQADFMVNSDNVKKEAERKAEELISEAENHARYMKLKTYEYIDKLLYDMQNDIASMAESYVNPMNNFFSEIVNNVNTKVNQNRQEMKEMAEKVNSEERTEDSVVQHEEENL